MIKPVYTKYINYTQIFDTNHELSVLEDIMSAAPKTDKLIITRGNAQKFKDNWQYTNYKALNAVQLVYSYCLVGE